VYTQYQRCTDGQKCYSNIALCMLRRQHT